MFRQNYLQNFLVGSLLLTNLSFLNAVSHSHALLMSSTSPKVVSMQVRVPSQFSSGQGSALCGLEALYNAFIIAKTITSDNPEAAFKALGENALEERQKTFDQWKRIVGIGRAQSELMREIKSKLATLMIKEGGDTEKRKLLELILIEVACELVKKHFEEKNGSLFYTLNGDVMRQAIIDILVKRKQNDAKGTSKPDVLIAHDEIDSYFKLQGAEIKASGKIQDASWICSEEIEWIIEKSKLLRELNVPIFHTADGIPPSSSLLDDPILTTQERFKEFKKNFQGSTGRCLAIFLVYSKVDSTTGIETHEAMQTAYNNGHWYCAVPNKVGDVRQYIVADSANNMLRLEDKRLLELANLLEGNSISSNIARSDIKSISVSASQIIESRELSNRTSFSRKVKTFVKRHPILLGGAVSLLAFYVLNKVFKRNKKEIILRSRPDSDGRSDNGLQFLKLIPQGSLHGAYYLP